MLCKFPLFYFTNCAMSHFSITWHGSAWLSMFVALISFFFLLLVTVDVDKNSLVSCHYYMEWNNHDIITNATKTNNKEQMRVFATFVIGNQTEEPVYFLNWPQHDFWGYHILKPGSTDFFLKNAVTICRQRSCGARVNSSNDSLSNQSLQHF